jgi:hypothetical protein
MKRFQSAKKEAKKIFKSKMQFLILLSILVIATNSIHAQTLLWANGIGGYADDRGSSCAVDAFGNVYTTGYFRSTVDFDPGSGTFYLTSAGSASSDIFVTKISATGNLIWAKHMGGTGNDYSYSIAVDTGGNVYTTGIFSGTADFDPGPSQYNLTPDYGSGAFISKLNSNGNFVWAKKFGGGSTTGLDITLDNDGNIYTTGTFFGGDFDPGAGIFNLTTHGNEDCFISKLDITGNFLWAKGFGGYYGDLSNSIAVDVLGNVYTTGNFTDSTDFDPGAGIYFLSSGAWNRSAMFISKLDAFGNFIWAKKISGTDNCSGSSIALDTNGYFYCTGHFQGNADFDPGPGICNMSAGTSMDALVCKFDVTGNFKWAKSFGGNGTVIGNSIALDEIGNIYTTGYFVYTIDFDPGISNHDLSSTGTFHQIFISKLDSIGNYVWAQQLGGLNWDEGHCILPAPNGSIYVTGFFADTAYFDPLDSVSLISNGSTDIFTAKYCECSGVIDDTVTQYGFTLTANASGIIYQWLDCTSGFTPIIGQTGQSFTAQVNGNYAVEITQCTCKDTSSCYLIYGIGLNENIFGSGYKLYPNPTDGRMTIDFGKQFTNIEVTITNILGQKISNQQFSNTSSLKLEIGGESGVYFIKINSENESAVIKLLKR